MFKIRNCRVLSGIMADEMIERKYLWWKKNGNKKYILYLHPGGALSLNWLFESHMSARLNQ